MDAWVIVSDALRAFVVAGCLLVAALSLRLAWVRRGTAPSTAAPRLATTLAFAGLLLLTAARRVERVGEPLDWWFAGATVCVVLGGWGLLQRMRLPVHPPWKPEERARRSRRDGHPRP